MIIEKIKSKFKRKTAIVEPKFWKIFTVSLLICLVIFSLVAKYALGRLDDRIWEREVYEPSNSYREEITRSLTMLSASANL